MVSTIREIIVQAAETYQDASAIRYKISKKEIASKSYAQLREDSERFSNALEALGEQGNHIAITGMTSYSWLV